MFNFMGKWIWKINILPRIQVFVRMYLHDSIDLKDCFLMARGIVNDTICALSRRELVMIIHALRACDVVKTIGTSWKLTILIVIFSLVISKIGLEKTAKCNIVRFLIIPPGRSPSYLQFGSSHNQVVLKICAPSREDSSKRYGIYPLCRVPQSCIGQVGKALHGMG